MNEFINPISGSTVLIYDVHACSSGALSILNDLYSQIRECVKWIFIGFFNGEEKDKVLACSLVLTIPIEFENLWNVTFEEVVPDLPCIATKGSIWSEVQDKVGERLSLVILVRNWFSQKRKAV